jgi:hypothetical protein
MMSDLCSKMIVNAVLNKKDGDRFSKRILYFFFKKSNCLGRNLNIEILF